MVETIDRLPGAAWKGHAYRHVAANRPPLSGEGARFNGGRWNPPRSFPVLYLGLSREVVVGEFHRLAARQHLSPQAFLPRTYYTYEVELTTLLDLRMPDACSALGLGADELSGNDLASCQAVGEAAHVCNREGIIVPGAAGDGDVLAVFIARLRPSSMVKDVAAQIWETLP